VQRGVGADTSRSGAVVRGGSQRGTCRKLWIGEDIDAVQVWSAELSVQEKAS
jgi:hypothetical protein